MINLDTKKRPHCSHHDGEKLPALESIKLLSLILFGLKDDDSYYDDDDDDEPAAGDEGADDELAKDEVEHQRRKVAPW